MRELDKLQQSVPITCPVTNSPFSAEVCSFCSGTSIAAATIVRATFIPEQTSRGESGLRRISCVGFLLANLDFRFLQLRLRLAPAERKRALKSLILLGFTACFPFLDAIVFAVKGKAQILSVKRNAMQQDRTQCERNCAQELPLKLGRMLANKVHNANYIRQSEHKMHKKHKLHTTAVKIWQNSRWIKSGRFFKRRAPSCNDFNSLAQKPYLKHNAARTNPGNRIPTRFAIQIPVCTHSMALVPCRTRNIIWMCPILCVRASLFKILKCIF